MTPNQRRLQRLVADNEPRLAAIAATTLRAHLDGRAPRSLLHLALYEDLGMPLKGWLTAKELRSAGLPPLKDGQ